MLWEIAFYVLQKDGRLDPNNDAKTQALGFSRPISKRFLEAWKRSGGGCDGSDG
jgi:hypothetical protein